MSTKFFSLLVLFVTGFAANSQNMQFGWAKANGGTKQVYCRSIVTDLSNNVYTTGDFWETTDFDPGPGTYNLTSNGLSDIFIQKLSSSGQFLWVRKIGGIDADLAYALTIDFLGNLYITGMFTGTVDFNPGPGVSTLSSNGYFDIFLLKLNPSGNFMWATSFGSAGSVDNGLSVATDPWGSVYVAGHFQDTLHFSNSTGYPLIFPNGSVDAFVVKFDLLGNLTWVKSFGGPSADECTDIVCDPYGNVYVTGSYQGVADLNPNAGTNLHSSNGKRDPFILKLKSSGSYCWSKSFGGAADYEGGFAIASGQNGDVVSTGVFQSPSIDLDPGSATYPVSRWSEADIYVQKLDSAGNFKWGYSLGGSGNDNPNSIFLDSLDQVYLVGCFEGSVDFDPGANFHTIQTTGSKSIFCQKTDSSGNFMEAVAVDGIGYGFGNAGALDHNYNLLLTGQFAGTFDFDPGPALHNLTTNTSWMEGFVLKLFQCAEEVADSVKACVSYTWIDGNTYNESNSTATFAIKDAAGCDSLISLYLHIPQIDTTVSKSGSLISAKQTGATYQWLNCNNSYLAISGETGQSFSPDSNGRYAVEISYEGCVDTSSCTIIDDVSLPTTRLPQNINIHPNPTTKEVIIEYEELEGELEIFLSVYTIHGKLLLSEDSLDGSPYNLNLPDASGMFLIELRTGNAREVFKVLKE